MARIRPLLAGAALTALAACGDPQGWDFDVRDFGRGFDTSEAARNVAPRPAPDERGVISYPNYQVVVARRGDTIRSIAGRLGVDAESLARYNGVGSDIPLRRDEIVALPTRVADLSGAGPIQPPQVNVTALASNAIDRAGPDTPIRAATAPQTGFEPIRHQVQRGETIYSIARNYDIPVRDIAEWNGLGADLETREGQFLLIPVALPGAPAAAASVPVPGTGSPTPEPPSAATPLPADDTAAAATPAPEAPDLGGPAPAASNARLQYPVNGPIIRAYSRGRNDGISIGVPAGTQVRAAGDGTVAAITQNTDGASIVVLRHAEDLLTVYVNLDELQVARGDRVRTGQTLARVPAGDPSFLHFEVREGLESVDPAEYLP